MTHKERAIAALTRCIPDHVPTFELEYQLAEEMFGKPLIPFELQASQIGKLSPLEKERLLYQTAEYCAYVYGKLEYSIIPVSPVGSVYEEGKISPDFKLFCRYLREITNDEVLLAFHGDGTFSVPDGDKMYGFAYRTVDDSEGLKAEAEAEAAAAIERNKRMHEVGIDVLMLCSDYCYNSGPFLSPEMFAQYIQPYLYRIIQAGKADGQYTIKHTDGNIMPILDQLAECKPHALHSLDPMAGVDIREVKRLVGDKVCLCGNVHCAALQTGTDEEVTASAQYCLTYGKPDGGYIFCTSNVPFKGMPPERYQMILDIWKQMRDY